MDCSNHNKLLFLAIISLTNSTKLYCANAAEGHTAEQGSGIITIYRNTPPATPPAFSPATAYPPHDLPAAHQPTRTHNEPVSPTNIQQDQGHRSCKRIKNCACCAACLTITTLCFLTSWQIVGLPGTQTRPYDLFTEQNDKKR